MSVEGPGAGARPPAPAEGRHADAWGETPREGLRRDAGRDGATPGQGEAGHRSAAELLRAESRFVAALADAGERAGDGQPRPQEGDGDESAGERGPRAASFAVVILPGDRPAAPAPGAPPSPAEAARLEGRVERVLAAVQAEIAAGAATGLRAGPGGALTFTFPLPVPDLGIAGAVLTLEPGRLDLALSGAGPLAEAQAQALRDLAASLALRHPDRVVRVLRADTDEDAEPTATGPAPFSPFAPLRGV